MVRQLYTDVTLKTPLKATYKSNEVNVYANDNDTVVIGSTTFIKLTDSEGHNVKSTTPDKVGQLLLEPQEMELYYFDGTAPITMGIEVIDEQSTPAQYTLTINPTPADATVVLTAAGFTQVVNSITADDGTTVSYSVSKTGYITSTGTYTLNGADHTENVVLEADQPLQTVPIEIPDDIVDMTIYYQPYQSYESSLYWDSALLQPVRATSPDDSIMNVFYHIATTNPSIINSNGNQYYSLVTYDMNHNSHLPVTNTAGDILYVQGTITDGEDFGELSGTNEIYTYNETNNTMVSFMQFYEGQTGPM